MSRTATIIAPVGETEITTTRAVATRQDGRLVVDMVRSTARAQRPTRPANPHSDFWKLDYQSPARNAYLFVL